MTRNNSKIARFVSEGQNGANLNDFGIEESSEPKRKRLKASFGDYESDSSDPEYSDTEPGGKSHRRSEAADDDTEGGDIFALDEPDDSKDPETDKDLNHDEFDKDDIEDSPETHLPTNGEIGVEAFNVEEERENGYFDDAGNYIQNEDEDAIQDQDLWINDVKDPEKAAESKRQAENSRRTHNRKHQESARHFMTDEALLRLQFLLSHEGTVIDSLARLNKRRESGGTNVINSINYISDLISILETKGFEDVYSLKREDVTSLYAEEALNDSALIDDYKSPIWTFKWLKKPERVHGPHTNYEMQYWKQSYFQNGVAVRFHDDPDKPENWLDLNSITFI